MQTHALMHGGDHVMATLRVAVLNNRTVAPSTPIMVGVNADAARTQLLADRTLHGTTGCARKVTYIDIPAPLPIKSTETLNYYVRVDPFNLAGETSMADNDLSGIIVPDPRFLFLPAVVQ